VFNSDDRELFRLIDGDLALEEGEVELVSGGKGLVCNEWSWHGVIGVQAFDGEEELQIAVGQVEESVEEFFVDGVGVDGLMLVRSGIVGGVVVVDYEFQ
jgi:hypothetical protein